MKYKITPKRKLDDDNDGSYPSVSGPYSELSLVRFALEVGLVLVGVAEIRAAHVTPPAHSRPAQTAVLHTDKVAVSGAVLVHRFHLPREREQFG